MDSREKNNLFDTYPGMGGGGTSCLGALIMLGGAVAILYLIVNG